MAAKILPATIPFYLLFCLLLGGSSRGDRTNLLLQLGAIAILAWAALTRSQIRPAPPARVLVVLMAALVALFTVQLIRLPPAVWDLMPGREEIVRGFNLLHEPLPWMSWSLAPYDTLTSALWLLPPFAIVFGMLRLGAYRDQLLALVILVGTFFGIVLGALQVTSRDVAHSSWYLYQVTNHGRAVGQFANSNHMATLLVATVPFIAALYGDRSNRKRRVQAHVGKSTVLIGAMFIVLLCIALNGSLAGIGLAVPAFAASLFISSPLSSSKTRRGLTVVGLIGIISIGAVFSSPFQNNLTTPGVEADYSSRYNTFTNSMRAAADYFPFGSGIGTFANVYPPYENQAIADRWFVNHAHNDYIEVALETGVFGILLVAAVLLWWARRTVAVWRAPITNRYARAATIASGAILAHSVVDFPVRTSSIAAVFAMCLALMAEPRRPPSVTREKSVEEPRNRPRHLSIG